MSNYLKLLGIWLFAILAAVGLRYLILQGAPQIILKSAPPLSGAISQSLASSEKKSLPQINSDYTINRSAYLLNREWVVVNESSLGVSKNNAYIILHKVSGSYRVVLGPGTAFSSDETLSLPASITQYLKNSGVIIYSPSGGQ